VSAVLLGGWNAAAEGKQPIRRLPTLSQQQQQPAAAEI